MNNFLNSMTVLLGISLAAGCSPDNKSEKKVAGGSQGSGFALKSELCGSYPAVGDFSEKSGNRRQLVLDLAMGICGKMEGAEDKEWHALGMTMSAPVAYVHKSGSAFAATASNTYQLFIEDEKNIIAVNGSKTIPIGTITVVKKTSVITLADGVEIELAVGDRQYQINDAKTVPDSEKKLFIATEQ